MGAEEPQTTTDPGRATMRIPGVSGGRRKKDGLQITVTDAVHREFAAADGVVLPLT